MGKRGKASCKPKNFKESLRGTSESSTGDTTAQADEKVNGVIECSHASLSKMVDLPQIKKHIKGKLIGRCEKCAVQEAKLRLDSSRDANFNCLSNEDGVWMCLSCGHQGCGRSNGNKHALSHYEAPRSGNNHPLVLHEETSVVWCYACDMEVPCTANNRLSECVAYLRDKIFAKLQKAISSNHNHTPPPVEAMPAAVPQVLKKASKRDDCSSPSLVIKGLANLGNTCFFNAVMQCLSQTHLFMHLLRSIDISRKSAVVPHRFTNCSVPVAQLEGCTLPTLTVTLRDIGSLSMALTDVMTSMRVGKCGSVNPNALFGEICKKAPRFKGFRQQDSHELLRYLLDGVRTEEINRYKGALLSHFGLSESTKPCKVDPGVAQSLKAYGRNLPAGAVDLTFRGVLASSVRCLSCCVISTTLEPFFDLSLPIADKKGLLNNSLDMGKLAKKTRNLISGLVTSENVDVATDTKVNGHVNSTEKTPSLSKHLQRKAQKQQRRNCKKSNAAKQCADNTESDEVVVALTQPNAASEENRSNAGGTSDAAQVDQNKEEIEDSLCDSFAALGFDEPLKVDERAQMNGRRSRQPSVDSEEASTNTDDIEDRALIDDAGALEDRSLIDYAGAMEPLADLSDGDSWQTDCSLGTCLAHFTGVESLTGKTAYACEACGQRESALDKPSSAEAASGSRKPAVKYTSAEKRILIKTPPAVLTLHLKRFEQLGYSLRKASRFVEYPLRLDLTPYCCRSAERSGQENGCSVRIMYSLYALVEHSGNMQGGHYVACVKWRPENLELILRFLDSHMRFDSFAEPDQCFDCRANFLTELAASHARDAECAEAGKWFYVSDKHVTEISEAKALEKQAYILFYERLS